MEIEGFIDIHSDENSRVRIRVFLDHLEELTDKNFPSVDFLFVTKLFKDYGDVSGDALEELFKISTSDQLSKHEQMFAYLRVIMRAVSTDRVYTVFCIAGCDDIFPLFIFRKYRDGFTCVGKVSVPYNKYSSKRYRFIKTCVDNNCFNMDKKQKLSNLRRRAIEKVSAGASPDECQKHLEEKVLIDLHYVQLHGVNDLQKRFDILHDMNETRTHNLDRTSLDLTYHSKMAVTYAKIGQQTEAEQHIQQTLVMCDRCLPCFATIMALNDVLYAYQELCFVNRSQDLLNKAKDHGQLMYHVITCEDEEAVNQWKRIILLFLAMTCLKISHEFEVNDRSEVSIEDEHQANVFISEVKKVSTGIETRREMVLNLCQGRIHERGDKRFALSYIKKAYNLVDDGCLQEIEKINIDKYLNKLQASLLASQDQKQSS